MERAGGRATTVSPQRVVHVITTLDLGGAEVMLYRLLKEQQARVEAEVVCLSGRGPVAADIEALGVRVRYLDMPRGVPDPRALARLVRWLREIRPEVLQTWMYHADLLGGLAGWWTGIPVVWGLHHTTLDAEGSRPLSHLTRRLCARLSHHVPARIVSCSHVAAQIHIAVGYRASRVVVIPNGFDTSAYRPSAEDRAAVRGELGVGDETPLVGLVARFDPQKDHENFVMAASRLSARLPAARFVLCGRDVTWDNEQLRGWIDGHGVRERMLLLGPRRDVPRVMAALDVVCSSSSFGEAMPLVLGEAMACGVPCVGTDVGDTARLIAEAAQVVPPRDPEALALALERVLALAPEARRALGRRARARIMHGYGIDRIAARYHAVWQTALR